jgi:pimeloyl-ACP methyl ester carboxylesterase
MKVKNINPRCYSRLVLVLCVAAIVSGCSALSPAERFDSFAKRAGMQPGELAGAGFRHRTFAVAQASTTETSSAAAPRLHIYFEGDGTPFLRRDLIAADPTPRTPLTLGLMEADSQRAVLLGRPCYHGLMEGCDPSLWTVGRYSEAVVASMAAATQRLIDRGGFERVIIIGYSGGGVLALLVADRLRQVDAVVTVAANLDLSAWTRLHGYSPLAGSIDPARTPALRPDLRQLHLTGEADDNVPPSLQRALVERVPGAEFRSVPGFDHRCCWVAAWPAQLEAIERWLEREPAEESRTRAKPPPINAP